MNFFNAACLYVGLGWRVFPLRPGSKKTLKGIGVYDATDDEDIIAGWERQTPNANIAVACGPETEITVVDVDKHHGGIESLKALLKANGELPKMPMSQSPRGGFHMYFAYDKRVGNSTNRIGKGIDCKSKGGYVVLPPSWWDGTNGNKKELDGGGHYTWVRAPKGVHLPIMPGWLIRMAMPPAAPRLKYTGKPIKGGGRIHELAVEISRSDQGARNQTLNNKAYLAFRIALQANLPLGDVAVQMRNAGKATGQSQVAVLGTVRSALTAAIRDHGGI
ncbi:hypothetical protein MnTg02_01657 [bacterium MnTg02]|nr:hypothetical protein MnTg02_01657 [bacterium MnTg02]